MTTRFDVTYLKAVKDKVKEGFFYFRLRGLEHEFRAAAEQIDRELQVRPREIGDPCFSLNQLKLDIFIRAVGPLVVHYGVHQDERLVFVHRLDFLES